MSTRQIITANIRARMAWSGMTVHDLQTAMGWSRKTASNKLHGSSPFSTDELEKTAELLRCAPGDLFAVPECFSSLSVSSPSEAIAA
jgi:hypothetical protein